VLGVAVTHPGADLAREPAFLMMRQSVTVDHPSSAAARMVSTWMGARYTLQKNNGGKNSSLSIRYVMI
jgi:hypothetical protein